MAKNSLNYTRTDSDHQHLTAAKKRIRAGVPQSHCDSKWADCPMTLARSLSPEAQIWYRTAVDAVNQGEMIPSPMVAHHRVAEDGPDDIDEWR